MRATRCAKIMMTGAVALTILAHPANAADCTFATAIYGQSESKYELRFQPLQRLYRFSGTTNVFFLDGPGLEKSPMAWVIWNNGESRPAGRLMQDCPAEAQTDEEFADCTLWQDVAYELVAGSAKLLPSESESPPPKILLPDFGRALRYSSIMLENPPWDVFEFRRCGQDDSQ